MEAFAAYYIDNEKHHYTIKSLGMNNSLDVSNINVGRQIKCQIHLATLNHPQNNLIIQIKNWWLTSLSHKN